MSAGVSAGGGKDESKTSSKAAKMLARLATQFAEETEGARTGLLDAMQEVLTTGGSSIPIISSAVDASRSASSRALQQSEESLATSGLAGTPFGENILAGQRGEGERSVAATQEGLAQNIFSMISNFVLGQGQTALSGLAGAIPGLSKTTEGAKAFGASGETKPPA